jgi:hypothetical protein
MGGKAKNVKRLLCVFFLALPARAKYGGGTGGPDDPYLIYNAEQMNAIGTQRDDWGRHFKLMADIDLSGYAGTDFNIIGIGRRNAFTGVFDGNGHTIANLSHISANRDYCGLFRYISGANAQIKDLRLIDPDVDAGTGSCVGSLAGYVSEGTITNCHVEGDEYVGGLAGRNGDKITYSFWDTETSGQSTSAGGVGRTTEQMKTASTFVGWGAFDGEGIWTIDEGSDYPRLWWENMPGEPLTTIFYGGGRGTETDPYLIYTAEELNMIGASPWDWGKHFRLMACIDLAAYAGTDYNIIGYYVSDDDRKAFTGVFDGNGKTISNFSYSATDVNNIGIFGYLGASRAKVRNLGLIKPEVTTTGRHVGSLVGLLGDGTVSGCYAEGGSVSGSQSVGGLVGWNWGGKMTDCYAGVSVSGYEEVGGLVGRRGYLHWPGVYCGEISRYYSTGSVSADRHVGGLVGYSYIGVVGSCFWDLETSAQPDSDGGAGKTTSEMQTADTFIDAGWDFVNETENGTEDTWCMCQDSGYPTLAGMDPVP